MVFVHYGLYSAFSDKILCIFPISRFWFLYTLYFFFTVSCALRILFFHARIRPFPGNMRSGRAGGTLYSRIALML
ncbi:hypothetical protein BRYFOR_09756 [Marvinbryantia formatexigens DSM 14469]|uniref:Acyltransferase 3 domain-containing protein n=1 Tax=Marvinbryantia formatexigens DSM 14469 TaxID=478749 RepID=C6LM57_9FIRM|nr:hypothetical protein BRYFOR_09756 [Marvinbryantia formatexigens DSM 14469]